MSIMNSATVALQALAPWPVHFHSAMNAASWEGLGVRPYGDFAIKREASSSQTNFYLGVVSCFEIDPDA